MITRMGSLKLMTFRSALGNGTALVTSHEDGLLLPHSQLIHQDSRSSLQYSPKSDMDYGVVACFASNSVGNQKSPCLFHVVPAGKYQTKRNKN